MSPERNLAIQLKLPERGVSAVEWYAASGLRTAVRLLEKVLRESEPNWSADPLLVIVDRQADEGLRRFSEEEKVPVAAIEKNLVDRIAAEASEEKLRDLARDHLLIEAAGPPVRPAEASAGTRADAR